MRLSRSRKSACKVKRYYLLEPILVHWKITHFLIFYINGEGRETVSAVFHCLLSILKNKAFRYQRVKKILETLKKKKKNNPQTYN